MAKSRNRSRDAKKRAAKKRANRERIARREREFNEQTKRLTSYANMNEPTKAFLRVGPNWDKVPEVITDIEEPKFAVTHCSQCGLAFGPGNSGYSHCEDHFGIAGMYE